MKEFLTQDNADMLWEIIIENDNVPKTQQTRDLFSNLFPKFCNEHKETIDLMTMNKRFIQTILTTISSQQVSIAKETALMTHEQIQEYRKTEFEKEMERKQREFTQAMTMHVPETPSFADTSKDEPIGNTSDIIKRMIAERNLDINNIQGKQNPQLAKEWLKSQDVSISTEQEKNKENAIKYIKIDKEELNIKVPTIDLTHSPVSKQVTWGETTNITDIQLQDISKVSIEKPDYGFDLFSKLKRKKDETENITINIGKKNEQSYVTREELQELRNHIDERFNILEQLLRGRNEYLPTIEPAGFLDIDA